MRRFLYLFVITILMQNYAYPQEYTKIDTTHFKAMEYRLVGPHRGGRSAAVTGVPGSPMLYYFGGTGGGVWKTEDGGQTWNNISDGFFGGSIGAVAVSEWDNNVIYVGGGEKTVRGNVSHGFGMWKSLDAGKTWKHIGLDDSRHIPRIRIHPKNPDLVYTAVLGHLFGPNKERGIYRSKDGGNSWEQILFVNENSGAVDLMMDPTNPRILYASFWRVRRTPYSLESGGDGSSLWKSTDGGDTWTEISRNKGLPKGTLGIIGVTVSPVNPGRVWAIVEAKDGGVFRSENGGETWRKINSNRNLRQRAWYYTRIYADTENEDIVYVLNVGFWKSQDGGKSFERIGTPHGDHHDLWIAPENSNRMVIGDDGGAQVTVSGGESWSTYHNQPTAQFYRIAADNHFPYRLYGGQQDNSTVRILHRTDGRSIGESDWESTAGGESAWLAPKPDNPDIVYGGSYGGYLTMVNHETGERRAVDVWPDNPMGKGAKDIKYRFQWNFPIKFSRWDNDVLYTAAQMMFKTNNGGENWEQISPDLTRNDTTRQGSSGGPITKDNTSVEYYNTIFTFAESIHEKDVIWTGSDDGLIHITVDGGKNWKNVTPPENIMPEWMQINSIEAHPFEPGGLYAAGTRYKSDDFTPYLYVTRNYGESWELITKGIDPLHFTRVIRADPHREGLLYAGTESGMYISFNDGKSWESFQLNLPVVPVTDLLVKNEDLCVATQGRSFWIMDDLTPLYSLADDIAGKPYHLFEPRETIRMGGGSSNNTVLNGKNLQSGVRLYYYLNELPDSSKFQIQFVESDGDVIRTFKGKSKERSGLVPMEKGLNLYTWNMRYENAEEFEGLILWFGGTAGPIAVPGTYSARMITGNDTLSVPFTIVNDPRSTSTQAELEEQFTFLLENRDKLTEIHKAIKQMRDVKSQIQTVIKNAKKAGGFDDVVNRGEDIISGIDGIENNLYQTKNESPQDPLNYPIKLNNRLSALSTSVSIGSFKPTKQAKELKALLTKLVNAELEKYYNIAAIQIPAFDELVKESDIPMIFIEEEE